MTSGEGNETSCEGSLFGNTEEAALAGGERTAEKWDGRAREVDHMQCKHLLSMQNSK